MTKIFFKYLLTAAVMALGHGIHAQLIIDNGLTPVQAVENILLGDGVEAFNITFSGDQNQIGSFNSNNSNIGIGNGMILATGNANVAIGPNNQDGSTLGGDNFGSGDPDLEQLSTFETNDAAILEFDFIPTGDSIVFNYVFASEEYNEYVCAEYNDAFGFFLSGPGINGPFSDNAENIAIIPGTNIPVTINTVNLGIPGFWGNNFSCTQVSPFWNQNTEYYIDNDLNFNATSTQFDGLTVTLTAAANVDCGETYHIKIAIADAGDTSWDSAVFLEADSFSSNAIDISSETNNDAPVFFGDSIVVEGCNEAVIRLIRSNAEANQIFTFEYGGSATPGVDYPNLPENVTLESGVFELEIPISAFLDTEEEETEDITISYQYINSCGETEIVDETLYIFDYIFPEIESVDIENHCPGLDVQISADVISGFTPFLWEWSNGENNSSTTVAPTESASYTVTATDVCGETTTTDINVTVTEPLFVTGMGGTSTCPEDQVDLSSEASGGLSPYEYTWSNGAGSGANVSVNPSSTTIYNVTATDECGNTATDTALVSVTIAEPLFVTGTGGISACPEDQVDLSSEASGGISPYEYTWSNGAGSGANVSVNPSSTTVYTVTATDECGNTATDTALVSVTVTEPLLVSGTGGTSACPEDQVDLSSEASGGLSPYLYIWSNGAGSGANVSVNPSSTTIYTVTATDECGNTATDTALVKVITVAPITILLDTVCSGGGQNFDIIGGTGNFTYTLTSPSDSTYFTINNDIEPHSYSTAPSTPPGIYEMIIQDDCDDTADYPIQVIVCETLIPNVFTPGDGNDENDTFQIPGIENFRGSRLAVWNRWGSLVFEDSSYKGNWNGKDENGQDLAEGTYFYILERSDGENFSGSVTIFR